MEALADPAYEQVVLSKAPGYEYKDEHGHIHGPYPAIAYFTWSLKGLLSPEITLRRPSRREFRDISYFGSEIKIVARIQLTNQMLDQKEWFYLDASQQVQGPFSAADMTGYVATRYMKESVKFYGRPIQQDNVPPPSADSHEFRTYGHLLDETMREYRREIKLWREKTYGNTASTQRSQTGGMANGLNSGGGASSGEASARTAALPMLTPVPPPSIDSVAPVPELTFDELRDTYAHQLFSNPEQVWYVVHNEQVFGPFDTLEQHQFQFDADTILGTTKKNVPFSEKKQVFATFKDHLKQLHCAGL